MPVINTGCSVEEAEQQSEADLAKSQPLPNGSYKVLCQNIEQTVSSKGRPQLKWTLETVEAPEASHNGRTLMHWVPLPHEGNNSGVGFLLDITKAFGKVFEPNFNTEDYQGRTAIANVTQQPPNEAGKVFNKIASFVQ